MKLVQVTPSSSALAGDLTRNSATVTGLASTALLAPGLSVSGLGIVSGTTILSVDSTTALTLSAPTVATGTVTLTFSLAEPVSLAEAKTHLQITYSDNDDLISGLIASARHLCETRTRRALCSRVFDLSLDRLSGLPCGSHSGHHDTIHLPMPPLVSVASVQYYDLNGALQTLDSDLYDVSAGTPGQITQTPWTWWPFTRHRPGAVIVRFTAGYGAPVDVPEPAKSVIKLLVGDWFVNRAASVESFGTFAVSPFAVDALLSTLDWGSYG